MSGNRHGRRFVFWPETTTAREEAFDALDGPIGRIGARSVPAPFGPPLEDHVMPSADCIVAEVRAMMGKAPG